MHYDIGGYKSQDIGVVAALLLAAGKRGKRYRVELIKNRDSLPFYSDYIDELLQRIDDFEKRYISS